MAIDNGSYSPLRGRTSSTRNAIVAAGMRAPRFRYRALVQPHAEPAAPIVERREIAAPAPHVLSADVFRRVVIRERKRADRSNQPFVLAAVSVDPRVAGAHPSPWRDIIAALETAKRETDLIGWLDPQGVIGIVMTEVSAFDSRIGRDIRSRMEFALGRRLSAEAAAGVSVRFHVYPDPDPQAADADAAIAPVAPVLQAIQPPTPERSMRDRLKRALDLAGAIAFLIAASPVFLAIMALLKLTSRDSVFFRQVRVGENGKPFEIVKFRTMRANTDAALHQQFVSAFIKGDQGVAGEQGGVFKIVRDPRVTPIGSFLRKTSLDELPQFWNVLRGDMSLVGPRPPIPYEVEQYAAWHRRRVLEAKPGITGLWQVAGRSRTTFDEMVRLDLRYARNCSLWTDIKILLATPKAVIAGKGAC